MTPLFCLMVLIPQIISQTTSKFDEASIATDMEKLKSNVEEIAEQDKDEESEDLENIEENGENPTPKYEKLVSNAINEAKDYIHDSIVDEHTNKEMNDKIFTITLNHLKRFWFTGQCKRDYSSPCPKGWNLDNNSCSPGEGYTGNCRSYSVNALSTSDQKEAFAYKCKADWPCANISINYNAVCPYNWVNIGNNYCLAPSDYVTKCSPIMNFTKFTSNEKAIWAMECGIKWPANHPSAGKVIENDKIFGALSDNGRIIYPQNY